MENVVEQNSIEPLTEEEKPVDENEALIQSQLSTDEDNEQVVTSEEENETENVEVQNDEFTNVEEIENSEVTEEAAVQTFSLMSAQVAPSVSYRTHVQSYGWLDYVADGTLKYTAVVISIPEKHFGSDIAARAYVTYTDASGIRREYYSNEGETEYYATNLKAAAQLTLTQYESSLSDAEKARLNAIMAVESV